MRWNAQAEDREDAAQERERARAEIAACAMTVRCPWCGRLRVSGAWVVADPPAGIPITDGICQACTERIMEQLARRIAASQREGGASPADKEMA